METFSKPRDGILASKMSTKLEILLAILYNNGPSIRITTRLIIGRDRVVALNKELTF